jgi:hypothetical protein
VKTGEQLEDIFTKALNGPGLIIFVANLAW